MATHPEEIESGQYEQIVREVVRQLHEMTPGTTVSKKKVSGSTSRQPTLSGPRGEVPRESIVKLEARVVTLAEVAGRLAGVKEVVIGPHALLTPAVRDVLAQQKIVVTRTTTEVESANLSPLLVGGLLGMGQDTERYWQQLQPLGIDYQQLMGASLIGILQEMCPLLATGTRLGMLLTAETALVLCLANRHPGIRAILATPGDATGRDTRAVGANLLIVSPSGVSAFQVGSMVKQFCCEGILPCPAAYRTCLS